jgi:hypothetical protein
MENFKKAINQNTIEKIILTDFEPSSWYVYKKEIKFLGIIFREKGIYNCLGHKVEPSYCVVNNDIAMEQPCVTIRFCSKREENHYFETFQEAKKFYDTISNSTNFYNIN